jgi:hypothetical protein
VPVAAPPGPTQPYVPPNGGPAFASSPYAGAPNPSYLAPGFDQASALNQALAGTGASVSPQQAAGIDPNAAGLLGGLSQFLIGPAQQALGAQTGQIGTQLGLSGTMLSQQAAQQQLEAGYSQQSLGLQGSDLALQQAAEQANAGPGGFQSQQSALTGAEQAYQFGQAQRALRSGATAAGSVNTAGTQQSWSDLLANYGFQQKQAGLTTAEQQSAYKTSMAQLSNAAKQLGISSQEVQSRLQNAINQIGLQGYMDVSGAMQAVQQLQQGFITGPQAQVLQTLLQAAGLPLSAFGG